MSDNANPPLPDLNAQLFASLLPETHGEKPKAKKRAAADAPPAAEDAQPADTAPTDTE